MAEIVAPGVLKTPKPRRRVKFTDIIIFVVLAVIIIVLAVTLISKLGLQHEVSSAQTTSDRVVRDIARQNASDARKLGDANFKAQNSATNLQQQFVAVAAHTKNVSASADRQYVTNNSAGQAVSIIYKYGGKQPFYIRVKVGKPTGTKNWQLESINGDTSEASLIVK